MIFHTAAEENYYNAFFKIWHRNILKHVPAAKFSLKFVGDTSNTDVIDFCKSNNIDLILDPTTLDELLLKHKTLFNARGHYPMARWNSIPVADDHVCVTDVDVIMIKNQIDTVNELLKNRQYVGLKRYNGKCKLMVNFINKNTCLQVRDYALKLMNSKNFRWDLDTEIEKWMYGTLSHECLSALEKFDSPASRLNKTPSSDTMFGYYSSVAFTYNNTTYANGFEAKSAKYRWASRNRIF